MLVLGKSLGNSVIYTGVLFWVIVVLPVINFDRYFTCYQIEGGINTSYTNAGLQIRVHTGILFFYFSTKTYVVVTQKNCLKEAVLMSTQNTCLN